MPSSTAIISLITTALMFIMWMGDRYGWFTKRKKPFRLGGKWSGWSVYREKGLFSQSNHHDDEHYFRISVELKQSFRRIKFTETIDAVFDSSGNQIPGIDAREFKGYGELINGSNVAIIFDETSGLTCGSMFLTINTWGTELSGGLLVRNVDGKTVLTDIFLTRSPSPSRPIQKMIEMYRLGDAVKGADRLVGHD